MSLPHHYAQPYLGKSSGPAAGSSRRVSAASAMSIDSVATPWWEDEATRGATALNVLRIWVDDPQKMAQEPVVLALADPSFGPNTPTAKGYDILRQMLLRFDAHRDFDHRSDWEAIKTYFGVYGATPTVPIVFWSDETAFLTCATNLAKLGANTRREVVCETHALRLSLHRMGLFVGHVSVRVGMKNWDVDETMGIGELRKYPEYSSNLAFMGPDNESLVFYPAPTAEIDSASEQHPSDAATGSTDRPASSPPTIPLNSMWQAPSSSSPGVTTDPLPRSSEAPPAKQVVRPSLSLWIPPSQAGLAPPVAPFSVGPSSPAGQPSSPSPQPPLAPLPAILPVPAFTSMDKPLPSLPSSDGYVPPPSQPRPQSPASPRRRGRRLSVAEDTGSREVAEIFSALKRNARGHQRRRSIVEPTSPRLDPYGRPGSPLRSPLRSPVRGPASPTTRPTSPLRLPRSAARTTTRRNDVVNYDDISNRSLHAPAFLGPPYTQRDPASSVVTTPAASSSTPPDSTSPALAPQSYAPQSYAPVTSFAPACFQAADPLRTPVARVQAAAQPRYPELPMEAWSPTRDS